MLIKYQKLAFSVFDNKPISHSLARVPIDFYFITN